MPVRTVFALLLLTAIATPAMAQDGEGADLVNERIAFIREMYKPSDAQIDLLRPKLMELVPAQMKYDMDTAVTAKRVRLAIDLVPPQTDMSEALKGRIIASLKEQLGRIWSRAPLSLSASCKVAEGVLSPEEVAAGRERIKERFADRLEGKPLNIDRLDVLAAEAIVPSPPPEFTGQASNRPTPTAPVNPPQPRQAQAQPADDHDHGDAALPRPQQPRQPQQPEPKRTYAQAPPLEEWESVVTQKAEKYNFSDAQRETARSIFNSVQSRAQAYQSQKKDAMAEAASMAEGSAKSQKLGELRQPLNQLYDELSQRVESIASLEQKAAADDKPASSDD